MQLDDAFEEFLDKIALDGFPEEKMQRAWDRLHDYLTGSRVYREVFLQGSWANDTAIRPKDSKGEYDVDVVAERPSAPDDSAADALKELEDLLGADGDYRKRLNRDKPCVRLEYADDGTGSFHIDIVPARPAGPLDVALRRRGWKPSNPKGYTQWCAQQGVQFLRAVRILKRWRDENQPARSSIKSIVLQVLIGDALAATGPCPSDAHTVVAAMEGIVRRLEPHRDSAPEVPNPVLPSENLTERWPEADYRQFRREVQAAAQLARSALEADPATSHDEWRSLLGKDFPPAPGGDKSLTPPPPPGYSRERQRAPRKGTERYG